MDFWTWNPIHSDQVREILAHATEEERRKFVIISGSVGLILGLGFAIVMAPIVGMAAFSGLHPFTQTQWLIAGSGIVLGLIFVIGIIVGVRRAVRNMLVNFDWAKEQGITKESLKLDRWS